MSAFERRVREAEEEIRRLPGERVYIFDLDGSVVFQTEGRENSVFIPSPIARGRLVIHNQPNGESLSRRGVQVLLDVQAMEELATQIRAKTLTGDEAGRQLLHRVWERVARTLGWDYRREELDP